MRYDEKTICVPDEVHEAVLRALGQIESMHAETGGHEGAVSIGVSPKNWQRWATMAATMVLIGGMGVYAGKQYFRATEDVAPKGNSGIEDIVPGNGNRAEKEIKENSGNLTEALESEQKESGQSAFDKRVGIEELKEKIEIETETGMDTEIDVEKSDIEPEQEIHDVPVDEDTYQEAHRYADDIEEVQTAISRAMVAGELPFVISSGIYENPVRVEVRMNTQDEEAIEKVKAFDPSGRILKIVYSEASIVDFVEME